MKPRIMLVGPHPSQIGGVATFLGVLLSSKSLREKFDFIHLDTSRGRHGEGVAGKFALINVVYFVRQIIQYIWVSLRTRPHIVHLPINFSWAFWKEAGFILLARLMRMKVIAHLHEGVFDQYYLKSSSITRWMIFRVLKLSDIIVALSNHWRDFLLQNISPDLHVEVVPNTVDPMFATAISKATVVKSEKSVLFVGGLSHNKGVIDILKAVPTIISCCDEAQFLFAGNPASKCVQEDIERLCEQGKFGESVKFLGVVTGQDKLELFQKSTIFVLPSYAENFPYALLEAMSVGLPVVTTPVGAIPELVEDGKNGFLITPGDHQALADSIIWLLQDPELRLRMGNTNMTVIKNRYLPEIAFHRFDQIYSNLALKW